MSDKKCSLCEHKRTRDICGLSQSPYFNKKINAKDWCDYFIESPAHTHRLNAHIIALAAKTAKEGKDARGNDINDAIREFETAIQLGLPQDDEMETMYFLGEAKLDIANKYLENIPTKELANMPDIALDAINLFEKAIAIEFKEGYGFFSSEYPTFQSWDILYAKNGSVIKKNGVDEAIIYLEQKLKLFDYLPNIKSVQVNISIRY